ncbi:hypothetical protein SAMN06269250_1286 [Spirosoma fluviale]|uniref:Uncharacterized protein n=2 Tax=Spirosoma fluviale TaxID=1597977 RepID=A0A286FAT2_9BACT|nr:hypothetical protein SAMN06269250_1286 [Spirosoma fluviale]
MLGLTVGTAFGQIPSPVPPPSGTWSDVHTAQIQKQFRQPAPPPQGGFWVVEENRKTHAPIVVHYYTDQLAKIQTDTLYTKRLNLKRRNNVEGLNERLSDLLKQEHGQIAVKER